MGEEISNPFFFFFFLEDSVTSNGRGFNHKDLQILNNSSDLFTSDDDDGHTACPNRDFTTENLLSDDTRQLTKISDGMDARQRNQISQGVNQNTHMLKPDSPGKRFISQGESPVCTSGTYKDVLDRDCPPKEDDYDGTSASIRNQSDRSATNSLNGECNKAGNSAIDSMKADSERVIASLNMECKREDRSLIDSLDMECEKEGRPVIDSLNMECGREGRSLVDSLKVESETEGNPRIDSLNVYPNENDNLTLLAGNTMNSNIENSFDNLSKIANDSLDAKKAGQSAETATGCRMRLDAGGSKMLDTQMEHEAQRTSSFVLLEDVKVDNNADLHISNKPDSVAVDLSIYDMQTNVEEMIQEATIQINSECVTSRVQDENNSKEISEGSLNCSSKLTELGDESFNMKEIGSNDESTTIISDNGLESEDVLLPESMGTKADSEMVNSVENCYKENTLLESRSMIENLDSSEKAVVLGGTVCLAKDVKGFGSTNRNKSTATAIEAKCLHQRKCQENEKSAQEPNVPPQMTTGTDQQTEEKKILPIIKWTSNLETDLCHNCNEFELKVPPKEPASMPKNSSDLADASKDTKSQAGTASFPSFSEESLHQQTAEDTLHQQKVEESLHQQMVKELLHQHTAEELLHQHSAEESLHQHTEEEALHQQTAEESLHQHTEEESLHQQTAEESLHQQMAEESLHQQMADQSLHQQIAQKLLQQQAAEESLQQQMKESLHQQAAEKLLNQQTPNQSLHEQTPDESLSLCSSTSVISETESTSGTYTEQFSVVKKSVILTKHVDPVGTDSPGTTGKAGMGPMSGVAAEEQTSSSFAENISSEPLVGSKEQIHVDSETKDPLTLNTLPSFTTDKPSPVADQCKDSCEVLEVGDWTIETSSVAEMCSPRDKAEHEGMPQCKDDEQQASSVLSGKELMKQINPQELDLNLKHPQDTELVAGQASGNTMSEKDLIKCEKSGTQNGKVFFNENDNNTLPSGDNCPSVEYPDTPVSDFSRATYGVSTAKGHHSDKPKVEESVTDFSRAHLNVSDHEGHKDDKPEEGFSSPSIDANPNRTSNPAPKFQDNLSEEKYYIEDTADIENQGDQAGSPDIERELKQAMLLCSGELNDEDHIKQFTTESERRGTSGPFETVARLGSSGLWHKRQRFHIKDQQDEPSPTNDSRPCREGIASKGQKNTGKSWQLRRRAAVPPVYVFEDDFEWEMLPERRPVTKSGRARPFDKSSSVAYKDRRMDKETVTKSESLSLTQGMRTASHNVERYAEDLTCQNVSDDKKNWKSHNIDEHDLKSRVAQEIELITKSLLSSGKKVSSDTDVPYRQRKKLNKVHPSSQHRDAIQNKAEQEQQGIVHERKNPPEIGKKIRPRKRPLHPMATSKADDLQNNFEKEGSKLPLISPPLDGDGGINPKCGKVKILSSADIAPETLAELYKMTRCQVMLRDIRLQDGFKEL